VIDTATQTPKVTTNREPAHYPEAVDDDDMTDAQRVAVDEVRAARAAQDSAARALREAIDARVRTVQKHEPTFEAMGWRRAARAIGVPDTSLRGDARRRLPNTDQEN